MALLFLDSFDHYQNAHILSKWTSAAGTPLIEAGAGRCGTAAAHFDFTEVIRKGLVFGSARCTVGFAFRVRPDLTAFSIPMCKVGSLTADHVYLQWNFNDGSLQVFNAGAATSLGLSAPGLVDMGHWYFLELQTLIHATAGVVIVRLNNTVVLSASGVNTLSGSDPTLRQVSFWGYANREWYLDDLYVLDDTGPAPLNDFLGDCRVEYLRPRAAGASQQWSLVGSASSHWQAVDDAATPDDDTTAVQSITPGQVDTNRYQPTGLPAGSIFGAQLSLYAKKTEVGPRTIAPVVNAAVGTTLPGLSATTYQYYSTPYGTNPTTGLPWTISDINAAEFGVKVIT